MTELKSKLATTGSVVRSRVFAEGVRFVAILVGGNLLLLAVVFGLFSLRYEAALSESFVQEFAKAQLAYDQGGLEAVVEYLDDFDQGARRYRYAYMLLDENGDKIVGQLDPEQDYVDVDSGWLQKRIALVFGTRWGISVEFLSDSLDLPGGYRLMLATFVAERRQAFLGVVDYLIISTFLSIILSLLMIFSTAATVVRRLEPINRDIDIVMTGDLSHRLDSVSNHTELEKLVDHINEMLDRIQELMAGVKQVSDNIAHDLRTPLTRLRNNLASLERSVDDENKEAVRELIVESDHLIATFNSLLRIARIELGESPERKDVIVLDKLVYEVVELYEPVASEKSISISSFLHDTYISGERNLLFQAIANVLDNAIKYTPKGGSITVELTELADADLVQLKVIDTGCGIKEENLQKVFRRFFREDSSRTSLAGNGLGLSLVAAVLKMHGASIELKNRVPGLEIAIRFPSRRQELGH